MKRWKVTCAYDGTDLLGWQSQPNGNTVQDFIEKRLATIFKSPIRIHGSGRTDAGVHAKAQVFHFDAHWPHPTHHLLRALQSGFPKSILILNVSPAPHSFHARFSVSRKRYIYQIFHGTPLPHEARYFWALGNRKLNLPLIQSTAQYFLGTHDFSAFSVSTGNDESGSPIKTIYRFDILKKGPRIRFITEGSGYLYKMVRSLSGTLVEVGLGRLDPLRIPQLLLQKQRTNEVVVAPALGLSLDKVFYESP